MSQSQQQQLKARPIRRIRIPGPGHEVTESSKANSTLEKSLMSDLNQYVNLIRTELDKKETLQWTDLHSRIMPRLRASVFQTIRGHLTQSYQVGAQYVTDKAGLGTGGFFLTHQDIDNVKALAETYTDKFFGRVALSFNSTIKKSVISNTTLRGRQRKPIPKPADSPINPNYIVNSIAISASTKALAEGTRQKAKTLLLTTRTGRDAILSAAGPAKKKKETEEERKKRRKREAEAEALLLDELTNEDEFTNEEVISGTFLGLGGGVSLAMLAGLQLQEQQWIWVTAADDRVCDICEPLEGEVYTMEDIDLAPVPIDSTHENCRCRLLLL